MSVEHTLLQITASISAFLIGIETVSGVSADIRHSLDLALKLCKQTRSLIELCGQKSEALDASFQDTFRITYAIAAASHALEDLNEIITRYNPPSFENNSEPRSTVTLTPSDARRIARLLPDLKQHHATVAKEVEHLKALPNMTTTTVTMTKPPERRFENLGLLKSMLSGSKTAPSARSGTSSESSLSLEKNVSRISLTPRNGPPVPTQSPALSQHSGKGSAEHSIGTADPVSRVHLPSASPEQICPVQDSCKPNSPASEVSLAVSVSSGRGQNEAFPQPTEPIATSAASPLSAPTQTSKSSRSQTAPTPSVTLGLQALFKAPVRLGARTPIPSDSHVPSGPPFERSPGSRFDYRHSSEVSAKSSMASFQSQSSGYSIPSAHQSALEATTTRSQPKRATIQSAVSYGLPLTGPPTTGSCVQRPRSESQPASYTPYRPDGASGRSQLFVYQPRVVPSAGVLERRAPGIPGDAVIFELEGASPNFVQPTKIDIPSPRGDSVHGSPRSSTRTSPPQPIPEDGKQELETGSPITRPGASRDRVDSGAWQRRTKLLQIDDPDGHLRVRPRPAQKPREQAETA
ncbi:hypothetical protein F5Y15DRAFT_404914 [Xylariaceae sp. FL0016]|nr:hypothetical protein F5Y15DRAFT_404914 [Xylariaceae sp. FL0016]